MITTLIPHLLRVSVVILIVSSLAFSQSEPESHLHYKKLLKSAQDDLYQEFLKAYDDYLEKNPTDVFYNIERCKFIENAFYDEYDEYNPRQDEFDIEYQKLLKRFPNEPAVRLNIFWVLKP